MSNLQRGVKYFNAFEPSRPKYIPPGRTVPRRNHPISFLLEVRSERKLTTTKNQNWDKKQYWDKKWKKIETKEYFPIENIHRHVTPRSGFESFAEYTQCLQEGTVRLAAMADIKAGEEIYVRHAPGDIQWSCFHPDGCKSGTVFDRYTSQHHNSNV